MSILADIFNVNPNQSFEVEESDVPTSTSSAGNDFFESIIGGEDSAIQFGTSEEIQEEVEELIDAGEELITEVLDTARDATVSVLSSNEMEDFISAPSLETLGGVIRSDEVSSAVTAFTSIFQTEEFHNVIDEAVDVFKSFFGLTPKT